LIIVNGNVSEEERQDIKGTSCVHRLFPGIIMVLWRKNAYERNRQVNAFK